MNTTSESLLQRLQSGSIGHDTRDISWNRFVDLYTPLVFYWARRAGLQKQDAADLVQEVLAVVLQKLPAFKYDSSRSFRGWLRTITLNKYREVLRKKKLPEVDASNSFLGEFADMKQAETSFDLSYARELVAHAAAKMEKDYEPETWKALKQLLSTGKKVKEIAADTGVSAWTLYSARSKLLKRLNAELDGLLD